MDTTSNRQRKRPGVDELMNEIEGVEDEIGCVVEEIRSLEKERKGYQTKYEELLERKEADTTSGLYFKEMLTTSQKNREQLRDKEKQLRDNKKQLRDQLQELQSQLQHSSKKIKLSEREPLCSEDMTTYVDRPFATLENLSKKMNQGTKQPVLFFTGPSGTGKTTTLQMLYRKMKSNNKTPNVHFVYLDAKNDNLEDPVQEGTYVFVDEAQALKENKEIRQSIRSAKALCLAFSPILVRQGGGVSLSECGFQYTAKYCFRPFTFRELDDYVGKHSVEQTLVDKVKELDLCLPRAIQQCCNDGEITEWMYNNASSVIRQLEVRTPPDSTGNIKHLRRILIGFILTNKLTDQDGVYAFQSGLFYRDDSGAPRLVYPAHVLLNTMSNQITSLYHLYENFDKGAAFEFLVYARLNADGCKISCMGEHPTPVGNSLSSAHPTRAESNYVIPKSTNCCIQAACGDTLKWERCTVIKLCENHFAIDFLIYQQTHGSASQKLFLVQASLTKYLNRKEPALTKIFEKRSELSNTTVVQFYCQKANVSSEQCFFVFATTEVPNDAAFSRKTSTQNKVYFLKVVSS